MNNVHIHVVYKGNMCITYVSTTIESDKIFQFSNTCKPHEGCLNWFTCIKLKPI